MNQQQKLLMLLNEPCVIESYSEREKGTRDKKSRLLKNIYPTVGQVDRFKHLEEAREINYQNIQLDESIQNLIGLFLQSNSLASQQQLKIEKQKTRVFQNHSIDSMKEGLDSSLQKLQNSIQKLQIVKKSIFYQKTGIQNILENIELLKALTIQNQFLRQQNIKLTAQQKKLDLILAHSTLKKTSNFF